MIDQPSDPDPYEPDDIGKDEFDAMVEAQLEEDSDRVEAALAFVSEVTTETLVALMQANIKLGEFHGESHLASVHRAFEFRN